MNEARDYIDSIHNAIAQIRHNGIGALGHDLMAWIAETIAGDFERSAEKKENLHLLFAKTKRIQIRLT